jgi:uncharacterized protein (DUF885 family)
MIQDASSTIEAATDGYLLQLQRVDPYGTVRDRFESDRDLFTDYSSSGVAARLDLARETLAQVRRVAGRPRKDRITAAWLAELTSGEITLWEEQPYTPMLRLLDGPIVDVIVMFRRVLGRETIDWEEVIERLRLVPRSLASMQANLAEGLSRDFVAGRRQAELFAEYCEDSGGLRGRGVLDWLIADVELPPSYEDEVRAMAEIAQNALLKLADFVRHDYIPAADPTARMTADSYRRRLRYYTGGDLDPQTLYDECWQRFQATMQRLRHVAHEITPTGDVSEAIWALEADAEEKLSGDDELCGWLSGQLDEIHQFVAGGILPALDDESRLSVRLARGEARAAMQASTPIHGQRSFLWVGETGEVLIPKWRYLALFHSVSVPGMWYQMNRWGAPDSSLTRAQQLVFSRSAYAGWGHYATRLLDEAGYYSTTSAQISYLQRELLQSVRVLVDVGYNLGLKVPEDCDICSGAPWSEQVGTQFVAQATFMSRQSAAGEMRRAISSPGQFPSYRVLSDAIVEGRDRSKTGLSDRDFLRQFHVEFLGLGPLGLKDLESELAQLPVLTPDGVDRTA